jgi:hypothetical protein
MTPDATTVGAFTELATGTGGTFVTTHQAATVVEAMVTLLQQEFRNLDFDRQVLATLERIGTLDIVAVTETMNCPRIQVASAIARLGQRGILSEFCAVATA